MSLIGVGVGEGLKWTPEETLPVFLLQGCDR